MTVSSTSNRISYAGNGVTTAFSFPYKFFANSDLVVVLVDDATNVETLQTITTHYTVTGAGADVGGTVTMVTAPATGKTLVIYRDPATIQDIDLVNGDPFDVETGVEKGFDKIVLMVQRVKDLATRAMRLSDADTSGASTTLPLPTANRLLGWNSGATGIENKVPAELGLSTVTVFAATLLDDATAGEFVETVRGGLAAETTVANDDEVILRDTSATAGKRIAVGNLMKAITGLTAETAPDVADEVAIYDTSAATADKITLADLLKVVNVLTEDTTPDRGADFVLSYDASATAAKKIKVDTLIRYEARRQTVVAGAVNASGQANFLSAGTGLAVSMAAATTPVVATFAAGEDAVGPINYRTRFAADQADYWSGLPALNLSFLMLERNATTGAISAYSTLIPPQYGAAFDATKQVLLHFEGADAGTTFTDEYGNAWTANGNAQIDTAQFKFGSASALFDGTGDFIENTTIASVSTNGSWTMEAYVRLAALPAASQSAYIMGGRNAGNFGVGVGINNTGGVYKLCITASSTGTSWDIADNVVPGAAITPAINTWYHIHLSYDALAGKLIAQLDGAAGTAAVVSTAAKICGFTNFRIGGGLAGFSQQIDINGWIDEVRISPCCRYPNAVAFTPPAAAFATDAEWFDTSGFAWNFGAPGAWTTKQRVAVGQATTAAAAVASVTTYALLGRYKSADTAVPAAGTKTSFSHNIGVLDVSLRPVLRNYTADLGYTPGDVTVPLANTLTSGLTSHPQGQESRTSAFLVTGSAATPFAVTHKGTGATSGTTATSWKMLLEADRGW